MESVRIGICGLGTVGYGSFILLAENAVEISRKSGVDLVVSHIASRRIRPEQDIGSVRFSEDVFAVVSDPEIDIVFELLGGTGLAKELVLAAITAGKHVVTANKALIAEHGNEIFAAAYQQGVIVAFEAAVAGGIPIIKAIREGLVANKIDWLAGIINGTGNYILTEMDEGRRDFADVLKEAQQLGYAEADPTFDVEGIDAAHKLTIMASLAFGIPLNFSATFTEGISKITQEDIRFAKELGYRIKHLGIAKMTDQGIELRVHPALVDKSYLIAKVDGVMNAVMVHGNAVGSTLYYGAGAGDKPTASAVVADAIDIVRTMNCDEAVVPSLGFQPDALEDKSVLAISEVISEYYLRITVKDEVGVMADLAETLGQSGISIEAVIQKESPRKSEQSGIARVVILTHMVRESVLDQAIKSIENLPVVTEKVTRIRIADLDD